MYWQIEVTLSFQAFQSLGAFRDRPEFTLDNYQYDLVNHVVSTLEERSHAVLGSTVGSGKSVIGLLSAMMLYQGGTIRAALVLAPQNQIKDSWKGDRVIKKPVQTDHNVIDLVTAVTIQAHDWVSPTSNEKGLLRNWLRLPNSPGWVSSHQAFSAWALEPDFLPDDLTDMLLIVDECHHIEKNNRIGEAVKFWQERGGKVLYITATLFRNKGELPLPDDILWAVRTLGEHLMDGRFSPERIKIRTEKLGGMVATTANQLSGEGTASMTGDVLSSSKDIASLWDKDGRPYSVICVPAKHSHDWARKLKSELESLGARVHIAVGTSSKDAEALASLLDDEKQAIADGRKGNVDVIIACKRFDEGTDWPLCSHVYNVGFPSSLVLIYQRLGRALRLKIAKPGSTRPSLPHYPSQFADEAVLTFLLPENSGLAWEDFFKNHRDHALVIGMGLHDMELVKEITAQQRIDRINDLKRLRSGNNTANKAAWAKIVSYIDTMLVTTKGKSEIKVLFYDFCVAAHDLQSPDPTDAEVMAYMVRAMKYTTEEAQDAQKVAHVIRNVGAIPALASEPHVATVVRKLKADVNLASLGKVSSRRIIRDALQGWFDDNADQCSTSNAALVQATKGAFNALSVQSGKDSKEVADYMREEFKKFLPSLTLAEIEAVVTKFVGDHNRVPNSKDGDSFAYSGYHLLFVDIIKQAKALGEDLTTIATRLGLIGGPKANGQLEFEAAVRKDPRNLELFVEAAVSEVESGAKSLSSRELSKVVRESGGSVGGTFYAYYSRLTGTLLPTLQPLFTTHGSVYANIDWAALGINPLDPKWDAYHQRAGGTLPRQIPGLLRPDGQLGKVLDALSGGGWVTLQDVAASAGTSITSTSARLRDLRKPKFGGWVVELQPTSEGGRYRLVLGTHPEPVEPKPDPTANWVKAEFEDPFAIFEEGE